MRQRTTSSTSLPIPCAIRVVEYEQDRRIGWEPEAGHGHPNSAPDSPEPARWGQRWSYQLTPDGPDATIVTEIYDCSQVPEEERAVWET